jgi:3',5'-cyclic AMP phosphodiesterase CpdA
MILVQLTDLHIRPLGQAAYRTAETNMLTERALRAVARLKVQPDAVVISGDLTDNGLAGEYALLADMLRRHITVPVYVIPGNHDRREVMQDVLADLPGVGVDPEFVQYAVDDHDVRLVMLDTVIPGSSAGELCAQRLAWLDETLGGAPNKPTIVVMHHPPFLCGIGHMDRISLRNKAQFAEVIGQHQQVKRILCGHHHRPVTGQVAQAVVSISPSVAHQVEFTIGDDPGFWNLEPAAFQVLVTMPEGGIVAHTVYVEDFPGPFPFMLDPDYPGQS